MPPRTGTTTPPSRLWAIALVVVAVVGVARAQDEIAESSAPVRPSAIVPWSIYQKRLKEEAIRYANDDVDPPPSRDAGGSAENGGERVVAPWYQGVPAPALKKAVSRKDANEARLPVTYSKLVKEAVATVPKEQFKMTPIKPLPRNATPGDFYKNFVLEENRNDADIKLYPTTMTEEATKRIYNVRTGYGKSAQHPISTSSRPPSIIRAQTKTKQLQDHQNRLIEHGATSESFAEALAEIPQPDGSNAKLPEDVWTANGGQDKITQRRLHSVNTFDAAVASPVHVPRAFGGIPHGVLPPIQTPFLPAAPLDPGGNNIVNSIFSQALPQAIPPPPSNLMPIQPAAVHQPPGLPQVGLEQLLSQGAPLEQISKFAKNIFTMQGDSNPAGDLLMMMSKALTGGGVADRGAALTSNAVQSVGAGPPSLIASANSEDAPQPSIVERLVNGAAQALQQGLKNTPPLALKELEISKALVTKPTPKLSAATKVQELLQRMPTEQRKLLEAAVDNGELDADSLQALVEENEKSNIVSDHDSAVAGQSKLIKWIQENRKKSEKEDDVSAERLPYYGKYCGSFAEQHLEKRRVRAAGAVWAVDERRIIVSKFYFQPESLISGAENVTFWAGPEVPTNDSIGDVFPSGNGFFLKPEPIDVRTFMFGEPKTINATVRSLEKVADRPKRDVQSVTVSAGVTIQDPNVTSTVASTTEAETTTTTDAALQNDAFPTFLPPHMQHLEFFEDAEEEEQFSKSSSIQPLQWFAGFQPILLQLPEGHSLKDVQWLSLRDHKRQQTVTSVLFPNGPAFKLPAVVQLRPLAPNGLFNISSGVITVLNTKTIEITDFRLHTTGVPLWFMIGKDLLPNPSGHIVPLWNRTTDTFDCTSLRDYDGESLTLRLPGTLDIRSVFWLAVYSKTNALSFAHLYVPYNDLYVPPDLAGASTPQCALA